MRQRFSVEKINTEVMKIKPKDPNFPIRNRMKEKKHYLLFFSLSIIITISCLQISTSKKVVNVYNESLELKKNAHHDLSKQRNSIVESKNDESPEKDQSNNIKDGEESTDAIKSFSNDTKDQTDKGGQFEGVFVSYFTDLMLKMRGPDVAFLIRDGKLYCRKSHMNELNKDSGSLRYRWYAQMIHAALQIEVDSNGHYGKVVSKIKGSGQDSGLPIIANWGDGCGCKQKDLNYRILPRLTWSYPIPAIEGCNPIGVPGYRAWKYSKNLKEADDWDVVFRRSDEQYPWSKKEKKAFWRGGSTGQAKLLKNTKEHDFFSLPRAMLVQKSIENPHIIDAAFHKLTQKFSKRKDLEEKTRIAPAIDMTDFMKYRAIIDIDGNGWSSRYGELLCMNSIVIKIQPNFGEYFYKDIQPWVHFIPVQSNMTDLVDAVNFVMDSSNENKVKQIIHNAHKWCRQAYLRKNIAKDMLNILVQYSDFLDSQDRHWRKSLQNGDLVSGVNDLVEFDGQVTDIKSINKKVK